MPHRQYGLRGGLVVGGASAPYAVTKHGVAALSESLYLTLQRRNALVKVSVLCPGLVRTNIVNAERSRPAALKNEAVEMPPEMRAGLNFMKSALQAAMPPLQVAGRVFDAIKNEQFYILTDHDWDQRMETRWQHIRDRSNPPLQARFSVERR